MPPTHWDGKRLSLDISLWRLLGSVVRDVPPGIGGGERPSGTSTCQNILARCHTGDSCFGTLLPCQAITGQEYPLGSISYVVKDGYRNYDMVPTTTVGFGTCVLLQLTIVGRVLRYFVVTSFDILGFNGCVALAGSYLMDKTSILGAWGRHAYQMSMVFGRLYHMFFAWNSASVQLEQVFIYSSFVAGFDGHV